MKCCAAGLRVGTVAHYVGVKEGKAQVRAYHRVWSPAADDELVTCAMKAFQLGSDGVGNGPKATHSIDEGAVYVKEERFHRTCLPGELFDGLDEDASAR